MNRYTSSRFLGLALVALVTACSAPMDGPPTTERPTATAVPEESRPASASASASASATPHDMGDMGSPAESVTVEISNFAFSPEDITVAAGTEVTFTNLDSAPHTATAGTDAEPMAEIFDSGLLEQGESFSFVFETPGEYVYFCDRHPPMQGSITVEG